MRFTTKLIAAAAVLTLASAPAPRPAAATTHSVAISAPAAITAVVWTTHAQTPSKVEVDVNTSHSRGAWYTQPVWIAIGIIALVLIILLIMAAGRRDTTTVVK
jgi:DMSO/TMAO reductase YedYZ heme-binding membrane subunit